jgi:hypothetical protein
MNRKLLLTGLATLMLAGSAAPASAQARRGSDIYISGGYGGWYGDYGYSGPDLGVSVGFGTQGSGYDNLGYGAYAAAPCTCGTSYRAVRAAPQYRYSTYASGRYPLNDYYFGGNYASGRFGWSDEDWRGSSFRDGRQFGRVSREDRLRISNRETRFNDRQINGGRQDFGDRNRTSRTSTSGASRTVTGGGAEARGGEFRSGTNPADLTVRSGGEARSGGAGVRAGSSSQTSAGARRDNR